MDEANEGSQAPRHDQEEIWTLDHTAEGQGCAWSQLNTPIFHGMMRHCLIHGTEKALYLAYGRTILAMR
jgi:hypothetical protein